jgi:hypothetical protein
MLVLWKGVLILLILTAVRAALVSATWVESNLTQSGIGFSYKRTASTRDISGRSLRVLDSNIRKPYGYYA